jgi:hypothetical protein
MEAASSDFKIELIEIRRIYIMKAKISATQNVKHTSVLLSDTVYVCLSFTGREVKSWNFFVTFLV